MSDLARQLADATQVMRCTWLECRNHIDHCRTLKGRDARPDHWFAEQTARLEQYAFVGAELKFIAANAESYAAWRASVANNEA